MSARTREDKITFRPNTAQRVAH